MQLLVQKNGHWNQRETRRRASIYIFTFYKESGYASGKKITENNSTTLNKIKGM